VNISGIKINQVKMLFVYVISSALYLAFASAVGAVPLKSTNVVVPYPAWL
jgi:hypothetical protein